jgi:transposase
VFIELRPKRYRCPTCDDHPTTTQQCDWYEPRSPHTKAFDQSLLRQLINSTVSDVARALLLECAPDLRNPYELREELSAIFDAEQSKESAKRAITACIERVKQSGLKCFDSFLTTIDNWLDEIINYFFDRQTSGFQEGFNNKIKVLKRRCYGITNISHLFRRIWLDVEGLKLFGI